ncbi:hypothetical protein [Kocuria tytonis]|uniref:Uncharacterized protein n=1 Tax=Kocuria tytonis TaxID=2054280 RepID=A0A495AA01_9MICC|nr:hypothetical protein [Kocuria tytonis]RKQ36662.1 hypothetical protein C1C97_003200 [Kocuria tytonis]
MTARERGAPRTESYGRGVRAGSLLVAAAAAAAVAVAFGAHVPDTARSLLFGAGLVALSSAASVLVAAQMFRVAPAATAPALAALYLLKVLALGWLLLVPGPPGWLVPGAFLGSALAVHVVATVCFVVLVRRVSGHAARDLALQRAAEHDDAAPPPPAPRVADAAHLAAPAAGTAGAVACPGDTDRHPPSTREMRTP